MAQFKSESTESLGFKLDLGFKLHDDLKYSIHLDWGNYYLVRNHIDLAINHFEEAAALKNDRGLPMINKSKAHQRAADIPQALTAAEKAVALDSTDVDALHQYLDCSFEDNYFAKAMKGYYRVMRDYPRPQNVQHCKHNIDMASNTIEYSIGKFAGPCLLRLRKSIAKMHKTELSKIDFNNKPRWKVLKELGKCDVTSEILEEHRLLSPLEEKRKDLNRRILHESYLGRSGIDMRFLEELGEDKYFGMKQLPSSRNVLVTEQKKYFAAIERYENMLRNRQPMFGKQYLMIKSEKRMKMWKDSHIFRLAEETRRVIFNQLVKIHRLARTDFYAMINYVEQVMSEYYAIKTYRVFPRKNEFINEIYNIVGIGYLNLCIVPSDLMVLASQNRMLTLLGAPPDEKIEEPIKTKVFGDKKQFTSADSHDTGYMKYKKRIDHFERRLTYTTIPIEICFICHETARLHLTQARFEEIKMMGRRIVENARACGNFVWEFLGFKTIVLGNAEQKNLDRVKEDLLDMLAPAEKLGSDILHYVKTAVIVNEIDIEVKEREEEEKRIQLEQTLQSRKKRRQALLGSDDEDSAGF